MSEDVSDKDRLAYRLADLFRDLGAKTGRDPLVLSCLAHINADPEGIRAWIEKQPPPPPPVSDHCFRD